MKTKVKFFLCTLITVMATWAIFLSESQSAQLGFIIAILFFLFFPCAKPKALLTLFGIIALSALAAPFVIPPVTEAVVKEHVPEESLMKAASVPHRLQIWDFTSEKALEKPLTGHGIEATRFLQSDQEMSYMRSREAMHPHNGILQIWLEFGLMGIIFGLIFLAYILRQISRAPAYTRSMYLAVLMGSLSIISTAYGLWQSWQVGLFILLAGISIAVAKQDNQEAKS